MVELCKHDRYRTITDIWAPKYSTDQVLINVKSLSNNIDHYLLKFSKAASYPDWLYFSGQDIRSAPTQANGAGTMFVVDMAKADQFNPKKECDHQW